MKLILTVPAYADFKEFADSPIIEGFRLNTNIDLKSPLEEVLTNLAVQTNQKPLWIDLKCRQLRIEESSVKITRTQELHHLRLNHKIKLNLPTQMFLDNGKYSGTITDLINNDTLVIPGCAQKGDGLSLPTRKELGPRPGMSVTITDPSLKIDAYFTQKDINYVDAAKKAGIHNYMLSFVEEEKDIQQLLALDNEAKIIAKIETPKGMRFVKQIYPGYKRQLRLMTARGDLYMQAQRPDQIIDFSEQIILADKNAIFASRLLESLINPDTMPKCNDLFDIYCGMKLGYKYFMPGDDLCYNKLSIKSALGLFNVLAKKSRRYQKKELISFPSDNQEGCI